MNDLVGIGEASKALLDHIAAAIGTLYRPRAIRLEEKAKADAKAYELVKTTEAYLASKKLLESTEQDILKRASARIRAVEVQRQKNIEAVIDDVVKKIEAKGASSAASTIEDDWMSKYLDYVKEVSDQDIRGIWAEILARKAVKGKRSVSLLTLDSLRLLERQQAAIFLQICRRVATFRTCFPFVLDEYDEGDIKSSYALHALQELGLITIRNLRSQYEVESLNFPFPGFWLKLSEDVEDELGAFEGTSNSIITEAAPTFRGVELARVLLDQDLIPFFENYAVPELDNPYQFMSLEEQVFTLKEWFSLLSKEGGYKVEVTIKSASDAEYGFVWKNSILVPIKSGSLPVIPEVLKPLIARNA